MHQVEIEDLQKTGKLLPSKAHPTHILTAGMLLHQSPVSLHSNKHGISMANICLSCMSDLQHNKTPSLSLANGMWIGDIPFVTSRQGCSLDMSLVIDPQGQNKKARVLSASYEE